MSDTTESAVRRLRQDSPTVDAVCRQLEHQVDHSEASLVVAFAEIFLSKAPSEFLQERSTDALAHLALGAFRSAVELYKYRTGIDPFAPNEVVPQDAGGDGSDAVPPGGLEF